MENNLYKRTIEDVKSIIEHAKLDEKNLTDITQTIYFPTYNDTTANLKLLELNPHLLKEIQEGQTLFFKGGLNEKVVLCSDTKTYEVKEAEISNSLLLIPELKSAQATSKSPLKSPKNAANRSKEDSIEIEDEEDIVGVNRYLERKDVVKIFHDYFECREIQPRYRKLGDLLQVTRYSGPENEYCIDKKLLFTFDQLLDTIQCSRGEFIEGLRYYRAFEINGYFRILEYEYEYRVVSLMLGLIDENSWELNEIDKNITLESLTDIVSKEVLENIFEIYTKRSDKFHSKYSYNEEMVCRIVAQNILQQGLKFHIDEFLSTWQESLPEGIIAKEIYLRGIGLIDRDSKPTCVKALHENNLSTDLNERLKILFKTKEKWNLEQIEPYIEYFATPQISVTGILSKYARSMTINGQRIYVTKH